MQAARWAGGASLSWEKGKIVGGALAKMQVGPGGKKVWCSEARGRGVAAAACEILVCSAVLVAAGGGAEGAPPRRFHRAVWAGARAGAAAVPERAAAPAPARAKKGGAKQGASWRGRASQCGLAEATFRAVYQSSASLPKEMQPPHMGKTRPPREAPHHPEGRAALTRRMPACGPRWPAPGSRPAPRARHAAGDACTRTRLKS